MRDVPRIGRYTWARQWPSSLLEGFAMGVLGLSTFAVKRSLGGREDAVPLLIALWQLVWIFTPAVGTLLARTDPQRLFRRVAFAAFVPIMLVAFVDVRLVGDPGHGTGNLALFIVLMFFHYASSVAYIPHRGALLRANYAPQIRGRVYGLLMALSLAGAAVTAKVGGILLDRDPRWLRVIFPIAGIAGLAGFWRLGRIRWRHQHRAQRAHGGGNRRAAVWRAVRDAFRILVTDRRFLVYELGFMLYGAGFLCSIGLLVLYAEGPLGLSYDQWTWAMFLFFPLAQTSAMPLMGRLADRLGVVRASAIAFVVLAVFFALMPLVGSAVGLCAAYCVFGVAMAGVTMGWSLGPLHFAPDGRAHMYTALHFSMVGIRSIFAPWLGYLVKREFSFAAAFGASTVLVLLGAFTLWRLAVSLEACKPESSPSS